MNTRFTMFRTPLAAALLILIGIADANAASDPTMTVDARAPLQATLLPTVTVIASTTHPDGDATFHVAATQALAVTLMPTVRVTARGAALAVTVLPTVRVYAAVEPTRKASSLASVVALERGTSLAQVARATLAEPVRMVHPQAMP